MSTARGEAPRRGLYATFSTITPSKVHTMTAMAIATKKNAGEEAAFIAQKTYIVYPPTIMMSPWAKLSIFAMPYTIV